MRIEKLTGFVLQQIPIRSSRYIVTLFTRECGKRQGVLYLSKKQTRACLTPLTRLRFQLSGKEHQDLKKISEVNLERHFFDVAANYLGLLLLHHWSWLIDQSQPAEQGDERVFRLLDHCLGDLNPEDHGLFPIKNLYFETWLLHFCGVLPRGQAPAQTANHLETNELSEEARLWRSLDHKITRQIFQVKIEDLTLNELKLGSLNKTLAVLGKMWERFLGKELKTRALLSSQFKERRLL